MVLVIEEKSVGRFEWSWCLFACFKGCCNHILQLCSPLNCHFLKIMLHLWPSVLRVNAIGPGPFVSPSFRLPYWYHMELSFRPGSQTFLFIYSGICFSLGLPKSDPVKTTYFDDNMATELVFVGYMSIIQSQQYALSQWVENWLYLLPMKKKNTAWWLGFANLIQCHASLREYDHKRYVVLMWQTKCSQPCQPSKTASSNKYRTIALGDDFFKLSHGDVTSHKVLYYPNCLVSLHNGSVTTPRHRSKRGNRFNWLGHIPFSHLDEPFTSVR